MKQSERKCLAALSALAVLLSLAGCGRSEERAAAETERAAKNAADAAKTAGANAVDELKGASARAAQVTEQAAVRISEQLGDAAITAKVATGLAADKDLTASRISVVTHNGVVTLKGPAPTPAAKERASEIARNVKGVKSVDNQLVVPAG